MSTANGTPSPGATPDRDHAADSDDSLARKRQRMSEDPEPLIEVLPPEDVGTSLNSAIVIEDAMPEMANYSDSFGVLGTASPINRLEQLTRVINSQTYLRPADLHNISRWLGRHLEASANQEQHWQQQYTQQEPFFDALAQFACQLLDSTDALEVNDLRRSRHESQAMFHEFFDQLATLSLRILSFLPTILDGVLARRDSAQPTATGQQHAPLMRYLMVLPRLLNESTPLILEVVSMIGVNTPALTTSIAGRVVAEPGSLKALNAVLRTLSTRPRDFNDAWYFIDNAMATISFSVQRADADFHTSVDAKEVDLMITTVNAAILPTICQKHPRALPSCFHSNTIFYVAAMLNCTVAHRKIDSTIELYQSCWKSASESLPSGLTGADISPERITEACHGDLKILTELIKDLWLFQALKGYVSTDILDIRSIGITNLKSVLLDAWKATHREFNSILLTFLARYLHEGNFIEYIFSADSHANLVKESADILQFLSVTNNYTNRETDIVWKACTTSVEAEFFQASCDALTSILKHVNLGQLVYMAQKFAQTPAAAIPVYAVPLFRNLLEHFESLVGRSQDDVDCLEPFRICLSLLWTQDTNELAPSSEALGSIAVSEIAKLHTAAFTPEDRLVLYKLCHAQFVGRTLHIKSSLEILGQFLKPRTDEEAECILELFPVQDAVSELAEYVRNVRSEGRTVSQHTLGALNVRLGTCLRLMGLFDRQQNAGIEEDLWAYTIGDRALNSEAREHALDVFISTPPFSRSPNSIIRLFNRCIDEFLPAMSADCATARLANFLFDNIMKLELATTAANPGALLEAQPWRQLYRIATESPSDTVSGEAIMGICKVLFGRRGSGNETTAFLARQASFVRQHVANISALQHSAADGNMEAQPEDWRLNRAIDILGTLLVQGRASSDGHDTRPHIIVGGKDTGDRIRFTVKTTGQFPKTCSFNAPADCALDQLEKALTSVTGASEHNLARGPELQKMSEANIAHLSLEETGVQDGSIVLVHPKYSFTCDLGKLFSNTNTVEEEILANFQLLDALQDTQGKAADKMYNLLVLIPPPSSARAKVVSGGASPAQLFPRDRHWRTMYSVHVLLVHLSDCNKLGVADQDFIIHGARQVSDLLMDNTRPWPATLLAMLLATLNQFLQGLNGLSTLEVSIQIRLTISTERPKNRPPPPYLLDAERLAFRLFELLGSIQTMSLASPGNRQLCNRVSLTTGTYNAFIQLSRTEMVWSKCADTQQFLDVHACLLLADNPVISWDTAMMMKDFAKEMPGARAAYLHMLDVLLPEALARKRETKGFFDLYQALIMLDERMRSDEGRARAFVVTLINHVQQYRHVETPDLAIADDTFANLLLLLSVAIDVLKSLKQPLLLEGLSAELFHRLLFPGSKPPKSATDQDHEHPSSLALRPSSSAGANDGDHQLRTSVDSGDQAITKPIATLPLFHPYSRAICLDIVRKTSGTLESHAWLLEQITDLCLFVDRSNKGFPSGNFIRTAAASAGLSNLGMTCYMNSLLQQIYANIQLRQVLFDTPIVSAQKQGLIQHVQALFARMQDQANTSVETFDLARFLGISVDTQEDVHGFYTTFMTGLEQCMPDADSKARFTQMFSGKLATQIRGSCGHVSSLTEAFSDLSVTVQNKRSLEASLAEFVQGEPMQGANKYKCLSCDADEGGKLVDAMKRTCLDQVPDHLTVCLKRFTYDMLGHESKNNDYFAFPEEIDLSKYQREHLEAPDTEIEPDVFKLVGVIVHSGILTFGHYWSYVRLRGNSDKDKPRWVRLEDRTAREAGGFEEVRKECYGGTNTTHNGYVLFYQRNSSFEAASTVTKVESCSTRQRNAIPPRAKVPVHLAREIFEENMLHHRIGQLFDDRFHDFVIAILRETVVRSQANSADEDAELSSPTSQSSMESADKRPTLQCPSDEQLAYLVYNYLTHIAMGECKASKANELFALVKSQAGSRPQLIHQFVKCVTDNQDIFWDMLQIKGFELRTSVRQFLTGDCLAMLREHAPEDHDMDVRRMTVAHAGLLQNMDGHPEKWYDYFCLPFELTSAGSVTTRLVMQAGYFDWISDTLNWKAHQSKLSHRALRDVMRKRFVSFLPLYEFLYAFFSNQPRDAPFEVEDFEKGGRFGNAEGLVTPIGFGENADVLPWMLVALDIRHVPNQEDYSSYAPARLLEVFCRMGSPEIQTLIAKSLSSLVKLDDYYSKPIFVMSVPVHNSLRDSPLGAEILEDMCIGMFHYDRPLIRNFLEMLTAIYDDSPENVLNTVTEWAPQWLMPESRQPKRTENWLNTHLFQPSQLTENPGDGTFGTSLDFHRVNKIAVLVRQCTAPLRDAHELSDRSSFTHIINVMQMAQTFFAHFLESCNGVELAERELSTFGVQGRTRARTSMQELNGLLRGLRDWDTDALAVDEEELDESSMFETEDEEMY